MGERERLLLEEEEDGAASVLGDFSSLIGVLAAEFCALLTLIVVAVLVAAMVDFTSGDEDFEASPLAWCCFTRFSADMTSNFELMPPPPPPAPPWSEYLIGEFVLESTSESKRPVETEEGFSAF